MEEGGPGVATGFTEDEHGEFEEVVVAPLGAFAARDFLAGRDMIPTVGTMVHGMEEESLVLGLGGEVGILEEGAGEGEAGLPIAQGRLDLIVIGEHSGQAEESLGGDGGGGAVHRFPGVAGVGGEVEAIFGQAVEVGGAGVPEGDAIGATVVEVKIGRHLSGAMEEGQGVGEGLGRWGGGMGLEVFELFGEAEDGPGQAAGPGGEGGVTLLRIGAAKHAADDVEHGFVGGAPGQVIDIALLAVIHIVPGGIAGVVEQAMEQGDAGVLFSHEDMAEVMGEGQDAEGPDGIDEEGVGAVEAVDEPGAIGQAGPARGLNGAGHLEGEAAELGGHEAGGESAFMMEAEEIAVSGNVVEAVVMDTGMGDMGGHAVAGAAPGEVEELGIAGGFELEQGGAELKALGPFGPATGGVAALDGEHGGAVGGIKGGIEVADLGAGEVEQTVESGSQGLRGDRGIRAEGHGWGG